MHDDKLNVAAIVPVFNPEPGLVGLVSALAQDYSLVVVVDDGSVESVDMFDELPVGVVLLRHEVNCGKGRAMKTAMDWVAENHPDAKGVVFADGDGQHCREDVRAVSAKMLETDDVTFGVRDFFESSIPFRCRFGNLFTSALAMVFLRLRIGDTQTGLRAIPARLLRKMSSLPGDRYEYEMRMLCEIACSGEALWQVPIRTIYLEQNRSSHFRPIADSFKTCSALLGMVLGRFARFGVSSLVGFAADNLLFTLVLFMAEGRFAKRSAAILVALVVARALSSALNYLCNKTLVFRSKGAVVESMAKYFGLVVAIASLSYLGTAFLAWAFDCAGIWITCAKIAVELLLFVLAYHVQSKWVFSGM